MSQSSFILVLAILVVPITAIYVTFFSVGSGFEDDTDKADKAVAPSRPASKPEPHEIRHAA
jgi:hypothetical protein